jgi:hypothetical protein
MKTDNAYKKLHQFQQRLNVEELEETIAPDTISRISSDISASSGGIGNETASASGNGNIVQVQISTNNTYTVV